MTRKEVRDRLRELGRLGYSEANAAEAKELAADLLILGRLPKAPKP